MTRSPRSPAVRERGVSLVELMVALVLGLIVSGSALTLVMTQRQTFTATESLGRIQETARMAFELMVRDLRRAGGNPCDGRIVPANGLVDPDANWWTNWGIIASTNTPLRAGVFGYGSSTAFPDAAFGTTAGRRVDGTDAIELKSAMPPPGGSIVTTALTGPDDAIPVTAVANLDDGALLVVCNFVNASLFQVTGFSGSSIEHADDAGASAWQNMDDALDYLPTATSADYDENAVVAIFHASRWYVGCNGRVACDAPGGRSLYRANLATDSATPTVSVDEIATGVTDLELRYLAQGATDYVAATSIADWGSATNPIVGVRVILSLGGEESVTADGAVIQRTLEHTVSLRNRSP